ncbi:hypothetical protein BC832DRAFT_591600 [Gaertneriomyces semiglobifer]|nr:hypothetical protein BC832DRAFT_591600 [Gaertneriomyces semiglobifer]
MSHDRGMRHVRPLPERRDSLLDNEDEVLDPTEAVRASSLNWTPLKRHKGKLRVVNPDTVVVPDPANAFSVAAGHDDQCQIEHPSIPPMRPTRLHLDIPAPPSLPPAPELLSTVVSSPQSDEEWQAAHEDLLNRISHQLRSYRSSSSHTYFPHTGPMVEPLAQTPMPPRSAPVRSSISHNHHRLSCIQLSDARPSFGDAPFDQHPQHLSWSANNNGSLDALFSREYPAAQPRPNDVPDQPIRRFTDKRGNPLRQPDPEVREGSRISISSATSKMKSRLRWKSWTRNGTF